MENNQEMLNIIKKLEETNRKQLCMARVQCVITAIALLCCLAVLVGGFNIVSQLQPLAAQLENLAADAGKALTNLQDVAETLADTDLSTMAAKIDALVVSSQAAVKEAMGKINTIDIETLNKAIGDLADVVEPLSRLTHIFG